ncbi:hypothetical protein ACH5RR_010830 [Cinchona calisaya]|uniref:Uncharacterized protein n=1 Tax=Cinchona calisaya TaxID=153742 RepID=A0ABD3AK08_9GENT
MDDLDWEIGISTKADASFLPPSDNSNIDVEESDEEEYDDDDYEEEDDDDCNYDKKCGLACPFCSEDFDVLGLCCHIDIDHHKEAKAAKFRNGGSRPALSSLKKEFRDEHLHSPSKGSRVNSSPAVEPDSLLLPFLYNPQPSPKREIVSPPIEASPLGSNSQDSNLERDIKISGPPDNGEEKVQRCEFVRGLLCSTIFGDEF